MIAIALLFIRMLCDFFRPQRRLEAEILVLRPNANAIGVAHAGPIALCSFGCIVGGLASLMP
jgi:hypothetical protein